MAYRRPKPVAVTRLPVDDFHVLRFFIWPDIAALRSVTGQDDAAAYWQAPETHITVSPHGETQILNKVVGSIHFYEDGFGGGIFAHELQHFIQDWIDIGGIDDVDAENIAVLAGDLTNKFWNWFYDHFIQEG